MKRIVLSAFLLLLCFGVFRGSARAQDAIPNKATIDRNIVNDSETGNVSLDSWNLRYDTSKMANIGMFIIGVQDDAGKPVVRGVIPTLGQSMAYMIENPPASTEIWLADLLQNSPFLGEKVYAQGVGFSSLNPILPVWKVFRDLAYSAFVIIFLIIGFMIMFRRKLGAQTVVTITSALPTIVITLLLITFSYAICGLIIDLMYLSIYFIVGIFTPLLGGKDLRVIAFDNNIFDNGLKIIFNTGEPGKLQDSTVGSAASALGEMVTSYFKGTGEFISGAFGVATSVVGYVIIAVALFYAVIKLFFELLKSYVTFLIGVVFAPIQLLLAGFKGNAEFVQWFKNMAGALVPFPVVICMIFLAMVFGGQSSVDGIGFKGGNTDQTDAFQAPQISLGNSSVGAIQGLIALGVLMLIPEAVKLSKEWVGVKSPFEKELGMINANLQKGWSGGKLLGDFGPKLPGASNVANLGLSMAGRGAGRGLELGAQGAIGGGLAGAELARSKGAGKSGRIAAAIPGAFFGGLGGATVGVVSGGLSPLVEPIAKRTEGFRKRVGEGTKAFNEQILPTYAVYSNTKAADRRVQAKKTATPNKQDTSREPGE